MSSKLLPYESYKDSGVQWLEFIPATWSMSRLGFETWVRARLGWKGLKAEEYVESGFALLSTPDIKGREIDFSSVNFISEERYLESPEIIIHDGDILLAKDGSTLGTVNLVRTLPFPATVNSSLAVITPGTRVLGSFLLYLFMSEYYKSLIEIKKGGMGVPHLFQDDINRFPLPLPPLAVQREICKFLETQSKRINALIKEQGELIDLLREKRQSLILHAVTKGLDTNVKLKDSGVEWLGEIPEHWKVPRLAHVASVENGATPSRDTPSFWSTEEDGIPWLSSGDVNQYIVSSTSEWVSALGLDKTSIRLLPIGSLIVGMIGEGKTRGTSARLAISATINQNIAGIVPGESIDSEFLHFVFQASYEVLRNLGRGGNQSALNCEILSSFRIPRPAPHEQIEIASFLTERTSKIDFLTAEAESTIAMMQEHRSALISAVVTGKVKVPA